MSADRASRPNEILSDATVRAEVDAADLLVVYTVRDGGLAMRVFTKPDTPLPEQVLVDLLRNTADEIERSR